MQKSGLFSVIILSLLVTGLQAAAQSGSAPEAGTITRGYLDLSTTDPGRLTELKGEWEFYWDRLLEPGYFVKRSEDPASSSLPVSYMQVPSDWKNYRNAERPLPAAGCATYHLKVTRPRSAELLGIIVPRVLTAYKLWIDEQLVVHNGRIGAALEETEPADCLKTGFFTPRGDSFHITIQVANYYDISAGIYAAPWLGTSSGVIRHLLLQRVIEAFIVGIIFLIACYHIGIYLLRKKDAAPFFFGLFCLLIIIRSLFFGEQLYAAFFPSLPFELCKKFESLSFFMGPAVYGLFFAMQFRQKIQLRVAYALLLAGALFTLIAVFTPFSVYVRLYTSFHILMLASCLYFFIALLVLAAKKNEGAIIFLLGHIVLVISVIFEITFSYRYFFTPRGLLLFVVIQAIQLAQRSTQAYRKVESLSTRLRFYSRSLEKKVKHRTHQLEELIRQKTHFFINLSHELKTPLTLITNYFDKYVRSGEPARLEVIKRNLDKLKQDIISYLDWEKLQSGQVCYDHSQSVYLTELLEEKLVLFKEFAAAKGITMHSTLQPELYLRADPAAVDRVLNNLLDNAVKYNREQGQVFVTLQAAAGRIELLVGDTGEGIPADKIAGLFIPFRQLNHPKKNKEGLGVGLAITKAILDELQATITIDSTGEAGTTICVRFPQASPPEAGSVDAAPLTVNHPLLTRGHRPVPAHTAPDPDRYTLLVVEDNEDMLSFLYDELSADYNVVTARHGQEALVRIAELPRPDLILSDVMMDRMDGYEFFKSLREQPDYNHIPFIFLTVRNVWEEKISHLCAGAVDFIIKPFDIREVRAKIIALLLLKKRQRDYLLQELASVPEKDGLPGRPAAREDTITDRLDANCRKLKLTPREQEIIRLICKGLEYKEAARELQLAVKTIDNHMQRLYAKLQVHNKIDLLNKLLD